VVIAAGAFLDLDRVVLASPETAITSSSTGHAASLAEPSAPIVLTGYDNRIAG
jgi:hypothetical protein